MEGIVSPLSRRDKRELVENMRRCQNSQLRIRYLIILSCAEGTSPSKVADQLKVSRSTVYRVAGRFRKCGESGLADRREDNGERKIDEGFLSTLIKLVSSSPEQFGWPRPTWTRELLVATMEDLTGVTIHPSTMSKALRRIGARRGRPKPTVNCPWSEAAKNRRLRELRKLEQTLPSNEILVYEDEIDIHLNPKIGLDWMLSGQQKTVLTPGKNRKRYLAGALNARNGRVTWVEADRKSSLLFVDMLWTLLETYPRAKKIHIILDNYCIHSTKIVQLTLNSPKGSRLKLHFLPPYCPDHNRIERMWQDLHANVTRNHNRKTMDQLIEDVRNYLINRNQQFDVAA
jgi:transposase